MRNQPEPNRTESKKPEWFELLDGDAPSAQVTKVNKKLPLIAALVTGGIIASGALFAGASAENSTGQSAVASIDQSTASTSAPSAQSTTENSPSVANPAGGMQAPGVNGGDDEYWIGSSDLMHRNLDRRVESLVRIERPAHKSSLQELIDLSISDETASWHQEADSWTRVTTSTSGEPLQDLQGIYVKRYRKARP